jgi:hypothetical protein
MVYLSQAVKSIGELEVNISVLWVTHGAIERRQPPSTTSVVTTVQYSPLRLASDMA